MDKCNTFFFFTIGTVLLSLTLTQILDAFEEHPSIMHVYFSIVCPQSAFCSGSLAHAGRSRQMTLT